MIVEKHLIEALLTLVIMFNAGVVSFFLYKIRNMDGQISTNSRTLDRLVNRLFGYSEDPTAEGHLVETEERFNDIDEKLDEICQLINRMDENRREEHEEVRENLNRLVQELSEEEEIDIDADEFRF